MTDAAYPRMRPDLGRTRLEQEGRTVWVVKDRTAGKYFRFGELELWIMDRLDGSRSFEQVAAELKAETGKRMPVATIETFFQKLKSLGLTERTMTEKSLLLMETLRRDRKARLQATQNTLFRMRFSWGDPDRLFDRMAGPLRFFWTRGFVVASGFIFLLYSAILAGNWTQFEAGFVSLYHPATYSLGFIVAVYLVSVVVFMIHEAGHGLTCKHFGGEVHEIGMMLLYFSPAFYCNVNDAWTFEKRAHRLWVSFAGTWIQLWVAAFAATVWILTDPASGLNRVAFVAALLAGGISVLINWNPLLPLDGYYALLDWLGIPNLRARSLELVGAEAKRALLRLHTTTAPATPRERRIMLVYGCLALAYTTLVLAAVAHFAATLALRELGFWGWPVVAFGAWRLTRRVRPRLGRALRAWAAEHRPGTHARRLLEPALVGATLLVILALALPWTITVDGQAVVEPVARAWIRPAEPGWVDAVLVGEGQRVRAGAPLIRLRNPELELSATRARASAAALEREVAGARARGDDAALGAAQAQLAAARRDSADWEQRLARLTLRAPFAGTVATPHPEQGLGARVAAGDTLLELWRAGAERARVQLDQRDAGEVAAGDRVRIRFLGRPDWTWRTRVVAVAPAASGSLNGTDPADPAAAVQATVASAGGAYGAGGAAAHVDVLVPLGRVDPASGVRAGSVGRARVDIRRTSMAGAATWALRRLIRVERFL